MEKQRVIFQGLKIAYLYRKEVCILEDSLCRVQKLNSSDLFEYVMIGEGHYFYYPLLVGEESVPLSLVKFINNS